ncbi:hypothetical protein I316_04555 [Kwoniella heveanensis BCC8398]|uniref:Uncharacterized protein n=1 Tax=Kwoniella heveanensis BCC8398 TaxID=1296120 RepID=A0A1B9GS47_9TREE|nr:hypothetical protein I316_04555 [Kwoniella heveanensis BCC8398]
MSPISYPQPIPPPHPFFSSNGFTPPLTFSHTPITHTHLRRGLSDMIYLFIKTSPRSLTFSSACAAAIEGLFLGVILVQTTRYLTSFSGSDPLWAVLGIVFGAMTLLAQFGLNLWQTYRLIDKAADELLEVIIGDIRSNMSVLVIVGILNFVAAGFFGRRAWNLAGRKMWLLVPLVIGIFSSLGLSLGVAIKGFMLPSLAGDIPSDVMAHRLIEYDAWRKVDNRLIIIWAAMALLQDILVCALMTVMLLKERDGIQKTERTLLRLLLKLTYETMAGPVVLNIVNVVVVTLQGATFAGYSRIVTWLLGPVYFSAILQSLNYRKDVQRILRVTPTPRSRSRNSKDRSTLQLQRVESPSIPLTSVDPTINLGTKEVDLSMSGGKRIRIPSSTTTMSARKSHEARKASAGGSASLTGSDSAYGGGLKKDGTRERALTIDSEVRSNMTTDIVLSGEKGV